MLEEALAREEVLRGGLDVERELQSGAGVIERLMWCRNLPGKGAQ